MLTGKAQQIRKRRATAFAFSNALNATSLLIHFFRRRSDASVPKAIQNKDSYFDLDAWTHAVVTISESDHTIKIYKNGQVSCEIEQSETANQNFKLMRCSARWNQQEGPCPHRVH